MRVRRGTARLAALLLLAAFPLMTACGSSGTPDLDGLSVEELEAEKLRAEIRKLDADTSRDVLDWLPAATVAGALAGTLLAFWRYIGERTADRRQRETEAGRRLDESFAAATQQLGGAHAAIQVGAAVALRTFLRQPEPAAGRWPWRRRRDADAPYSLDAEVFSVALANLKLPHDLAVRDELVTTFALAARRTLAPPADGERLSELNLARADLTRARLDGLDLGDEADLGFTKLPHAKLTGAQLPHARGYGVQLDGAVLSRSNLWQARLDAASGEGTYFHEADLKSAHLKGAQLAGARFYKALLQSAHFDGADLTGASFEQANIDDAYFDGAELDDAALRSIVRAYHWETARFDDHHRHRLEELAAR